MARLVSMTELHAKHCVSCKGGVPPLSRLEVETLLAQVDGWEVVDGHHLRQRFEFKNFKTALAFVNRVGDLAEAEGHHPDLHLAWGRVVVEVWTHKIDGLSENDFILAAKIDGVNS